MLTEDQLGIPGLTTVISPEETREHIGLVDNLGGLEEAIASAAAMAELGEEYAVRFIEKQPSLTESLARQFLTRIAGWVGPAELDLHGGAVAPIQRSLLEMVKRETEMLASLNDPNGVYAICDCEVE